MSSLKSMSGNFVLDLLEQELGRISQICQIAEKYAPAYDQDAICRERIQGI